MSIDHESEVRRAEQAQMILKHPLFIEAFDKLDSELREAWIKSPSRDVEGRESLWLSVKLLGQIKSHMTSLIETGVLAEVELSRRGLR